MLQVPWYKKNLAAFKRVRSLLPELQEPQAETQSPKLPPPTVAANTEELELDDLEAIGAAPAQQDYLAMRGPNGEGLTRVGAKAGDLVISEQH